MGFIREWATIVSICAFIACFIDMLCPGRKMDKTIKTVLGIFMICAIFVPVYNTFCSLSTDLSSVQNIEIDRSVNENIKEDFISNASVQIENLSAEILKENGISFKKIDVFMDIDEQMSISIIRISVEIEKNMTSQKDNIKKLLEDNLDIQTDVYLS